MWSVILTNTRKFKPLTTVWNGNQKIFLNSFNLLLNGIMLIHTKMNFDMPLLLFTKNGKTLGYNWRCFPKELRVREKRPLRDESPAVPKQPKQPQVNNEEIIRKLETLEQKEEEGSSDEEEGKKKKPAEEEAEGEEEYDEEEFEDETDYIMSYFDNGEEFGGDSDDNIEEAIY
ncbi:hypothetical protein cypCar_00014289 [Cyprinus carpio]|nr:hypothetical protein cypCar_00014289 [Cyprinus carpio]